MFNTYFFNFLEERHYSANAWGYGHVLFFFDSYSREEMSHIWLRGWFHLLMQIMCVDGGRMKQNAVGWATFLPMLECQMCQTKLPVSLSMELLGLWPVLQRSEVHVCVCAVCVCVPKQFWFIPKCQTIIFMWSLLPLWKDTVWMPNETTRHKSW